MGFILSPKLHTNNGMIYDFNLGFETINVVEIQRKNKVKTRIQPPTILKSKWE